MSRGRADMLSVATCCSLKEKEAIGTPRCFPPCKMTLRCSESTPRSELPVVNYSLSVVFFSREGPLRAGKPTGDSH